MQASLGHFVDLVIRIDAVNELPIHSGPNVGELYLAVTGVDMDGEEIGPLRLWNHRERDVADCNICILKGLKIANEKQWNDEKEKYVSSPQAAKIVESDARTAIENVSDQLEIASYFQ